MKRAVIIVLWCAGFASGAWAQTPSPPVPAAPPDINRPLEVEPYFGLARHSPGGDFLGATTNRDHVFLGLHITAAIARWRGVSLSYAPETALLIVTNNPEYADSNFNDRRVIHTDRVADGTGPVAGAALSPVGFEARVAVGSRWRLYSACAAGFIMFTRPTPDVETRRFNYTFEFGGGIDFRTAPQWWLRVGYKFHHFSNAFSAPENPGVDANVVMIGVSHALSRK